MEAKEDDLSLLTNRHTIWRLERSKGIVQGRIFRYHLLRISEDNPILSKAEIARRVGVSRSFISKQVKVAMREREMGYYDNL